MSTEAQIPLIEEEPLFTKLAEQSRKFFQKILLQYQENLTLHLQNLPQVFGELAKNVVDHPERLVVAHLDYWEKHLKICQKFSERLSGNPLYPDKDISQDKRFKDPEWQNNVLFDFIKQNYLLTTQYVRSLISELTPRDNLQLAKKLDFYTRQLVDAISPTNFINTNPEVLRILFETGGKNLVEGFKNFLNDFETSSEVFSIKLTDATYFEIGNNLAITKGKVIYQNDVMQLIQYAPTTEKVYQNPLLIVPPWINKYYILDLRPENSFVKWLVDQGHTTFIISWVNPKHKKMNKDLSYYMLEGVIAALTTIKKITDQNAVNTIGYCSGGTLLACVLGYLAAKNDTQILSATFLATLLDFTEPGDLGVFTDEAQICTLEEKMQKKGYLEGSIMAATFSALRANELIWSSFINHYLKGAKPLPFDLLHWNSDSTNIPAKLHSEYLREMYLNNRLIKRGALELAGVPLDLKIIKAALFFISTKEDHLVPWTSSYQSLKHLPNDKNFLLAGSGHVAGIINPPLKNKYGYWVNTKKPKNPEKWFAEAKYSEGSWWPYWEKWLQKRAGKLVTARQIKDNPLKPLEDAPGSYVKVCAKDEP